MTIEQKLVLTFPKSIISLRKENNNLIIYVKKTSIKIILLFLKKSSLFSFKQLVDIYGIDKIIPQKRRFELQYVLLGLKKQIRIYIKCKVGIKKGIARTESVVSIYPSAGYLEREVWDLFGIFFSSHPDLRRIVTDYGFNGFPLRKDFPVTGFREVRYDDEKAKIIYEPVKYTQAYRLYTFETPWRNKE